MSRAILRRGGLLFACLLSVGCWRPNYVVLVESGDAVKRHFCSDIAFRNNWYGRELWCLHRRQEAFERINVGAVLRIDTTNAQEPWIPDEGAQ
jgi:hypothetical protein